jgi:hypothetical protein
MTLAELIQEVYSLTGRPDRVAETLSAIKSATLKAHQSDFYHKDLLEAGVQFNTAEYLQTWDYRNPVPLWRAAKYFRKYDTTAIIPLAGKTLAKVVPENVFDDYAIEKTDIWYAAGGFIQLRSSTKESTYLFGCYLNPDITEAGYGSWIALDHPYAIVFDAASTVFKAIGKDEEATAYRNMVAEQISELRMSNIDSVGY